jgi:hypothetical protein
MPIVKATREGLIGKRTSAGAVVDRVLPFVALPDVAALHQWIDVANIVTRASCRAIVLDVGPWNVHDSPYVFGSSRPQAESGRDVDGRSTNGAGIDLSEYVWAALGLIDNGLVWWEFCPPARIERGAQLDVDQVLKVLQPFAPRPRPPRRSERRPPAGPATS